MSVHNWFSQLGSPSQVALISAVVGTLFGLAGGIAGPFIKGRIDESTNRKQILYEAASERQAKLIDAQSQFIGDVTKAIWDWRYLSIRVAYEGGRGVESQSYHDAVACYQASILESFNRLRFCTSQARRLLSEASHGRLKRFYLDAVVILDKRIQDAVAETDSIRKQMLLTELDSELFNEVSDSVDDLLLLMSKDLMLSRTT